jgi:3-phytase
VDIAYNFVLGTDTLDIAVVTVRRENTIRIFSLPDMTPIDNGGISVFEGESDRDPMGISLFTDLSNGTIYAMVGRKLGPSGSYIWQYQLTDSGEGYITGNVVRQFGQFSGLKEIEALVSDNELGYFYASDEGFGIRKYYAHPDSSSEELAAFAFDNVTDDHEGLSIFKNEDGTGFLILSDQQGQRFNLYTREGDNTYLRSVPTMAVESDGNDITSVRLNAAFPNGLFVAMSDDKTFQFYRAEDIVGNRN